MHFIGEIISLAVALSWTATAIFAEYASQRLGSLTLNLIRMGLSILLLAALLWVVSGSPFPVFADSQTWLWLALSGLVGYVFGDFCLFNSYIVFGSRYGQLFMTLAPPIAGFFGWILLGESLTWHSWLAMIVTLSGIAISIMSKQSGSKMPVLKLPLKGVLFGIGAGLGQGVGLVLSKIGLECYETSLPADIAGSYYNVMPFAGTFIRAIFGFVGFLVIILIKHDLRNVGRAVQDRRGMAFASLTTLFGPFIGVSLSLMAVQYTETGIASTLMALTPVLIIAPYSIIKRQRVSAKEVFGAFVTVAGVALFFL